MNMQQGGMWLEELDEQRGGRKAQGRLGHSNWCGVDSETAGQSEDEPDTRCEFTLQVTKQVVPKENSYRTREMFLESPRVSVGGRSGGGGSRYRDQFGGY